MLPVVAPAPVDGVAPTPLRAVPAAAEADAEQPRDEAGTAVLAEPDLSRAAAPAAAAQARPAQPPRRPGPARRAWPGGW